MSRTREHSAARLAIIDGPERIVRWLLVRKMLIPIATNRAELLESGRRSTRGGLPHVDVGPTGALNPDVATPPRHIENARRRNTRESLGDASQP